MSAQENRKLIRRLYEETVGRGNLAVVDEIAAPDFVHHLPGTDVVCGAQALKQGVAAFRAAFPDVQFAIEDELAEGDRVAVRWTWRGTHQGAFMGIPATGRQVTMTGINIARIAGGKAVEDWSEQDRFGLLQQLGAVPAPSQPAR